MERIQITTPGIRKALKNYSANQAIAEYIWNGFDAGATCVEIIIEANEFGYISKLSVKDNGLGIPAEDLESKFKPFYETEKALDPNIQRNTSAIQGKNGVGRLTFFQFATNARWETVYKRDDRHYKYPIEVQSDTLHTYTAEEPHQVPGPTGTLVSFLSIHELTEHDFNSEVVPFLKKEFGWFLELNRARDFRIEINSTALDYSDIVGEREEFLLQIAEWEFEIKYVRWDSRPNEYSRYYYIDSHDKELYKKTTTLNNKGDHFYHSVFIKSDFFDDYVVHRPMEIDDRQLLLFADMRRNEVFKDLSEEVDQFLRSKRKPFLESYTDILIADFEKEGAFPEFGSNDWELYRKLELEEVVRELYQVEPRIFSRLNTEQKRTFVHLLNLIIDSGERDKLLEVLSEVVSLDSEEREELARLLQSSKLSAIIRTIKLIEDRYTAIAELQELVFNSELGANERDHIQKFIESHYWIFGEQYHLVSAAEPKFEEALRRYTYILRGEKKDVVIDHPDKNREMDIFLVRQLHQVDSINNIVVELKHPNVNLGEKELSQVKRYLRVIKDTPEFNAGNMNWEFFLVGNRYNTSGYIQGEMNNVKGHGEKFLVYSVGNQKIYVRTWSDIFTDFDIRHKFLCDKLKLERRNLVSKGAGADQIIRDRERNTAKQPSEITVPE